MKKARIFITLLCAVIIGMVASLVIAVTGVGLNKRKTVAYADAAGVTDEINFAIDYDTLTLFISSEQIDGYDYYGQFSGNLDFAYSSSGSWYDYGDDVRAFTTVTFLKPVVPKYVSYWFSDFDSLTTINNINYLDTSKTVGAEGTFLRCWSLTSLDLSSFDATKLTSVEDMFTDIPSLGEIKISSSLAAKFASGGIVLPNVGEYTLWLNAGNNIINSSTQLSAAGTYKAAYTPVIWWGVNSSWTTLYVDATPSNVRTEFAYATDVYVEGYVMPWYEYNPGWTNITIGNIKPASMFLWFDRTYDLTSITWGNIDTTYTTDMSYMLSSCNLSSVTFPENFNTSNVKNMEGMLCWSNYKTLDLSTFDTSKVENMTSMFSGCPELTEINMSSFAFNNQPIVDGMFDELPMLSKINISADLAELFEIGEMSSFIYANANMFWLNSEGDKISSPQGMKTAGVYTRPYTPIIWWYVNPNGDKLYISANKDGGDYDYFLCSDKVVPWYGYRGGITQVIFNSKVVPAYTNSWFESFTALTTIDLTKLDTSYTTDMNHMFYDCESLAELNLTKLNTDNVTNMENMFRYCSLLRKFDFSNFKVDACLNFDGFIDNLYAVEEITVSESLGKKFERGDVSFSFVSDYTYWTYEDEEGETQTISTSDDMSEPTTYRSGYTARIFWRFVEGTNGRLVLSNTDFTSSEKSASDDYGEVHGTNFYTYYKASYRDNYNVVRYYWRTDVPWWDYRESVNTLEIKGRIAPSATNLWFYQYYYLSNIIGIENLDCTYTTEMSNMFDSCGSLTSLDLSNLDVSHNRGFAGMLYGLGSLSEIKISESLAKKMDLTDFDVISVDFPWYYGSYEPDNMVTAAYQMDRAGTYVNPVTPVIYWGYSDYGRENVLTISTVEISVSSGDGGAFAGTDSAVPWAGYAGDIKKVVISGNVKPTYTCAWFQGFTNVTSIDLSSLVTTKVVDMSYMFDSCIALTELTLPETFVTSSVVNMEGMFASCYKLTSIDLSNFDTSKVTNMYAMFYDCTSLTSIDISNFDTSNVTNMEYLFYGCSSLESLNLITLNFDSCQAYTRMLTGLDSLTSITISQRISEFFVDGTINSFGNPTEDAFWLSPTKQKINGYWEMSEVGIYVNPYTPKIYWSYSGGTLTLSPDGTGDNYISGLGNDTPWLERYKNSITAVEFTGVIKPAFTSWWFFECGRLTSVTGLNFLDTSYTTHMEGMFYACSSLVNLDATYLKTGNAMYLSNMFDGCIKLAALNVSGFDTSNVLDMEYMFQSCQSIKTLDLSNFEVSYCGNFYRMFYDMPAMSELTISSSVSAKLVSSQIIFDNPTGVSFWISPTGKRVDWYGAMSETGTYTCPYTPIIYWKFDSAGSANVLTISSNAISERSFSGTSAEVPWDSYYGNIKKVVVEGTVSPSSTANWFLECTQLSSVDLSGLDTTYTTDMSYMFRYCSSLKSLDLSKCEVSNCAAFTAIFEGTDALEEISISLSLSDALIDGTIDSFAQPNEDAIWFSPSGRRVTSNEDMRESGKYVSSYTPIIYWDYRNRTLRLSDTAVSRNIMYGSYPYNYRNCEYLPWNDYIPDIETVIVEGNVRSVYTDYWFEGCERLISLDLSGLNTENTVSMSAMFNGCLKLETLDLSNMLTGNCKNMEYMFYGCWSLTSIDLSTFDMSACRAYTDMLKELKSLSEITISKSVAENMRRVNFDVLGANTPWYYYDDGPSVLIYDARQMTRAGKYVNPVSAAIYWQYGSNTLTISNTPFTGNYCGKIAVTDQFGENELPWFAHYTSIRSVVIRGRVAPAYTNWWFSSLTEVKSIDLTGLDTSYTYDMTGMFYNCYKLNDLKLGNTFDVSNVASMDWMFCNCIALKSLDLSSFETPQLLSMNWMFCMDIRGEISQLTELDLSNFNVSRCDGFRDTFYGLSSIKRLNVSLSLAVKLSAEAVVFDYPNASAYWLSPSGKKITYFNQMKEAGEYVCPYSTRVYWKNENNKLTISDMPFTTGQSYSFDPLNYADENNVYWHDVLTVENITSVMFVGNVAPASTRDWFNGFASLTAIDLSCLDTSYTTDMANMFYDCSKLDTLDLSGLNVSGCTDFRNIFYNIPSLKIIILSDTLANKFRDNTIVFENVNEASPWYTHEGVKVTASAQMRIGTMYINPYTPVIYWQYSAGTLTLSDKALSGNYSSFPMTWRMDEQDPWEEYRDYRYDTSPITTVTIQSEIKPSNTRYWFYGFSKLTTINGLDKLTMSYVTDMTAMFAECHSLKTLDLRVLSTSNVTDMSYAFYNCSSLESLDLSSFEMTNCKNTEGMLSELSSLNEISISASLASKMAYVDFTPINSAAWYYEDGTKIVEASKMRKAGLYTSSYTPVIYWNYNTNTNHLTISAKEQSHASSDEYGSFLVSEVFQTYDWLYTDDNNDGYGSKYWHWIDSGSYTPWEEFKATMKTVSFVGNVAPVNMAGWFRGSTELTSADLSGLNTANVTDFRLLFYDCWSLKSLDMSNLDVSSSMYYAYVYGTDKGSGTCVYNGFEYMLSTLYSLSSITLSETLAAKFKGGYAYIDNVTAETPWYHENGTKVNDSSKMRWAGKYGSSYSPVLYWSKNYGTLTISDSPISYGSDKGSFSGADCFTYDYNVPWAVYAGDFTSVQFVGEVKPLYMRHWFCGFSNITTIDLSNVDTMFTKDMAALFAWCSKLKTITFGSNFSTANVLDMDSMFYYCCALKELDLRGFNTEKVMNTASMFYCCCSLESLDLSNFTISSDAYIKDMLVFGDAKLKNINISLSIANRITETCFDQATEDTPWRRDGGKQITDVSQMTSAGKYYYDGIVVFKNGDVVLAMVTIEKGKPVVYTGTTPTKNDTADTAYVDFVGWTRTDGGSVFVDLSAITQSTTVYASFSSIRLIAPEEGIIYDGNAHAATFENKTSASDGDYTIYYSYSTTANGSFEEEEEAKRAGWHTAQIVFGSHSISVTYQIAKKEVKITGGVVANDKVYDATTSATANCASAVISGLATGDTVNVASVNATFADANANDNVSVSLSGWVLGGADAGNYYVASSGNTSSSANITKRDVTVEITVEDSIVGHVKAASAQVHGCDGMTAPVVTLTYSNDKGYNSTKLPDVPAQYTVTASIVNNNFNLVGNNTATFELVSPYNMITGVHFEQDEYFYGDIVRKPQVTATHGAGTEQITYYKDINRTQAVNITEDTPPAAGTYYVYIKVPANYDYGEATTTVVLVVKPKKVTVNIDAGGGVYGGEITYPTATVVSDSGTVPTVSFTYTDANGNKLSSPPVNAGTYTAEVNLSDKNYEVDGVRSVQFVIEGAAISDATVAEIGDQTYTGSAITPPLNIVLGSNTLVADKDYTVTYSNNTNVAYGDGNAVVAGASILISGIGNYTGTIELSFKITPVTITADMITVSDQVYTGLQLTPVITARYLGKSLVGNTDYTAVYGENINVLYVNNSVSDGGSITITGKGNFVGTVTKQFKIKPADISTASIGEISDKDYTGEAIVPDFDVTLGTVEVVRGVDYTLSVSANINVGTATATLTGCGNFTGSKKVTFSIVACEVTLEIAAKGGTVNNVVPATAKVYDKQNNELSVEVKFTYTDKDGKTSEVVPNVVGTYTVTASIANQNYVIKGEKTAQFVISSAINSITELTLDDWIFGNPNEPEVVAVSGDEAPVYYTYYLASDTLMDNPLSAKPEDVGSYVVKAEIFSTANYGYAQATKSFQILPAQLTADMVSVAAQTYTGAQIKPEVIISYLGNEYGSDYYEVVSYGENINVADGGSVTITASGNFEGSCTVNFEITAAEITSEMFSVADCTYTGEQLTPEVTFVFNETELGLDGLTVVYGENVNVADGGTVTITASGNFTGEVTVEFEIAPMSIYAVVTAHGAAAGSVKAATVEAFDVQDNKLEGVEFIFVYIDGDGNESEEIPQTVGSYTVKALPASANYSLTEEASAEFVVSAEANTVTVELEDWIYGTPAQPVITVNLGDASKAVITYYEFSDTEMADPLDGKPENVGKYRIKVYIPATSQYSEASDSAVFEIKAKEITVSGIKVLDKQFDGTAAAQLDYSEVTLSGLVGDDTLTLTATGTFDGVNKGEHSVTISEITLSGDAAANYTVAEYTETLTATIERRQVKVNITPNGGSADSEIVGATAQVVDLEGNVIDTEVTFTYTDKDGNEVNGIPQARGTYTVTVEIPDDNYELTGDNSTTFIVSASSNKITSFELEDWTYGSPNEPTVTAQHGDDTVVYTYYLLDEEDNATEIGTTQPKNAGNYKVVAFIPSTDDYASATAEVKFTINKKEISLDGVTAEGKVYDGTTGATLGFDGVTFDGLVDDDELTVTATGTFDGTDAGNHTVTVTEIVLSGDAAANYILTTTELEIENVQISAKTVSVEITVTNGVVGNVAFVVEVKILNDGVEIETDYSLVYYDGEENELEAAPESAGAYTVEVVLPEGNYVIGGECTAEFIISANANSATVELESWTYGEPNEPVITIDFGEDTAVKYFALDENGEIEEELEGKPENVGSYLITVSVEATTEYAGAEAQAQFEIVAKEVKAVITVVDGLFGETEAEASATVVDLIGNEVELEVTLTYTDADGNVFEEVPQAVGEYVVTAAISDGNYNLTDNTATLTISATGNTITQFVQDDWTYGAPVEPVLEAAYGAETAQYTYFEIGGNGFKTELEGIPQRVGNYEIVVIIPATAEYAAAKATAQFSILPKDVTVEITVYGGAANGNEGSVSATVIGYIGETAPEVTFTYKDGEGNTYSEMPRIAGTYTVIAAIADGNYTLTGVYTAEFIVSENVNSATVELEGWTYGEPNEPVINAEYGLETKVVTYYKLDENGEVVEEFDVAPENVGNYRIKVYIAATVEYEAAEASVEFTISPKKVRIEIGIGNGFLGAVEPATVQITDNDDDTVSVDIEFMLIYVAEDGTVYESLPEVAGKFTATVTISDVNYKVMGSNTRSFTIWMPGGLKENNFVLVVEDWTYGSPVAPSIKQDEDKPIYGADTVVYTYYMKDDHELLNPLEGMPETVGEYIVVASIAVNLEDGYDGASADKTFSILAKKVAAVIDIPESIQVPNGVNALEEGVPAQVTIEGLAEADWQFVTITYVSTDGKGYESEEAPVEIGKYKVVVTLSSENYTLDKLSATAVFTVAKKAEAENGEGSIELPDNREFYFIIDVATNTSYDLPGLSIGRTARLQEMINGVTTGNDFIGSLKTTLTFRVPNEISSRIYKYGMNLEDIQQKLFLYIIEDDGALSSIDFTPFVTKSASGDGGVLMVKVEYDGAFPAEFVFNDASYRAPKNGLPWWAWLLIAIGIVLVVAAIALVVVVIVLKKRKVGASSTVYITQEDEATKRKLAEHEQKIEELMNRDDGGFGTVVDPDDYDA